MIRPKKGIEGWVGASIRHSTLVYVLVAAMVCTGVVALVNMKKNEFPAFEIKQGLIAAVYPDAGVSEIEEQLAAPLEDILLEFKEVDRESLRSVISEGMCYMYVDLNCSPAKKDEVWSKIKLRLGSAKAVLPQGVLGIVVLDDFSNTSSMMIALESSDKGYGELYDYARDLETRLRRINELAGVTILGGRDEEIAVTLDREMLHGYAIDPATILLDYQSSAAAVPAGSFDTDYTRAPIRIKSSVGCEEQIADKVIYSDPQGNILRLKDVAKIERRYEKPKNFVSFNGNACIILSVVMRQNNNIVKFGRAVDKVLKEFDSQTPGSVTITRITDQSKVVADSVLSFLRDLVISMLVVIFVMLMLFPIRSALIASSGVPVCTAIAILIMYLCGMELNTVTLAALIVVLGMIVDDSIITMDGYMDKLERGYGKAEAAGASAKELFLPTFIATAAICLMFFPMLRIITGYLGDFIKLFPWVITFALMTSLLYAVTVVPSLETKFIHAAHSPSSNLFSRIQNRFFTALESIYGKVQDFCFAHPAMTVCMGVTAVGLGLFMFSRTTIQMMPKAARDHFVVEMELEGGNGIERTRQLSDSLQNILLRDSRVVSVTSFIGTGAPRFNATYTPILPGASRSQLIVNTISSKATESMLLDYESRYEHIFPEALIRFKQMDYQAVDAPIVITLKGEDRDALEAPADSIRKFMASMDTRLKWVHSTCDDSSLAVDVSLDREEASVLGVNKALISLSLLGSFNGQEIASVWEDGRKIPVRLYGSDVCDTMQYSVIADQFVPTAVPGVNVPLRQVASVEPDWERAMLERKAAEKSISILADMKYARIQPEAMERIKEYIDENISLPEGASIEYGGLSGTNKAVVPQIALSFLAAVAVLFIFLLVHFRKVSLAILTLLTSSLCLFGASFGLWVFNLDFGLTAVLGLVSLVGIIVRNGIILFDFAEKMRLEKGASPREAAEQAGKRRMRPIFLTSCTTALGVLPMIISGDLLWMPMGVVICFGIMFSIFLTVLIMPVSYWLIYKKTTK